MMRKLFFYIILFFLSLQVKGQTAVIENPYLKFSELSISDGLDNTQVLALFQSHDGYIWIGTFKGLFRYDGFRCKPIKVSADSSFNQKSQLITYLTENRNHELMVGTANGLFIYNSQLESFSELEGFSTDTLNETHTFIRAIGTDSTEVIWVETADGFLHSFNSETLQKESFAHYPPGMTMTYFYHSIFLEDENNLWIGGRYMGIYHFNRQTQKFSLIKNNPEDPRSKRDEDIAFYFRDSDGEIWVGGTDGLYTFDTKTKIFNKRLAVSSFSMIEENGNLWVGTGNGIFILNKKTGIFQHVQHDENNPNSITANHIHKLFKDRAGNIWIGTLDGISIFHPSKNKFNHIYHIPGNDQTPVSNHITSLMQDNENRIWAGSENQGLECFNENLEKIYHYSSESPPPFQLVSNNISTLMQDSEGDIWVGQWSGKGLNIINPGKKINSHWSLLKDEMKADWYYDFLQDKSNNYWIAIWGGQGLYRYNKSNMAIDSERFASMAISDRQAIKIVLFDGALVWVAFTNQNRLVAYSPQADRYFFYSKDHYNPFGYIQIFDIRQFRSKIQFSTIDKNIILDKSNDFEITSVENTIDSSPKQLPEIDGYKIFDYLGNVNGSSWAATDKGLLQISKDKTFVNYKLSEQNMHCDTLYSISFEPPDKLWIGTAIGLCYFNIQGKKFTPIIINDNAYLSSRLTRFLYEDSRGTLWVGTTDMGLMAYNKDTHKFTYYKDNPSDSAAFWGSEARCMLEDQKNRLWIGGNGLNQFFPQTGKFVHLTTKNGLADNTVLAILEDKSGNLWLSTNNGISCYNPEANAFINYSENDGLQQNQFTSAAFQLSDGRLMFGGKNGINIIDPDRIQTNPNPPPVVLTNFQIFNETHTEYLKKSEILELNYQQNYFSFEFAALDFSDPAANSYAYQLINFDDNWIFTSAERPFARYTNVEPGEYIFRVKAANSDGIWNNEGLSIPVIISPPFWKTSWFYGLVVILIFGLVYIYIKNREKKIMDKNRLLVMEQKLLRSQMNPHFIFNSLSSIQSFIFENNPVEAGSYLSRFAELIRSILYNSREEYISLEKELKTLNNYLELQQLRYNRNFDYLVEVDPELFPEDVYIPPMLAQPFIENAIEHGLKNLDKQGSLNIRFLLKDNLINIFVEDNGIGLQASKDFKDGRAKEHKSLATIITNERIAILNKSFRKYIYSMTTEDITNTDGTVAGTRVSFILPLIDNLPSINTV